jgi:hypothetical protein
MVTNDDRISSGQTAIDTFTATSSFPEAIQAFCVETEGSSELYDELDSVCKDMLTNAWHAELDAKSNGESIDSFDRFVSAVSTYLRNEEYPTEFVEALLVNAHGMAQMEIDQDGEE